MRTGAPSRPPRSPLPRACAPPALARSLRSARASHAYALRPARCRSPSCLQRLRLLARPPALCPPMPCRSQRAPCPRAQPVLYRDTGLPRLTIQFVLQYKPAAHKTVLQYSFLQGQPPLLQYNLPSHNTILAFEPAIQLCIATQPILFLQYNSSYPSLNLCNTTHSLAIQKFSSQYDLGSSPSKSAPFFFSF